MQTSGDQKRKRLANRVFVALISPLSLSALLLGSAERRAGTFDGARAYEHVRHLVEIGSRPPASGGIHRAQAYIIGQTGALLLLGRKR